MQRKLYKCKYPGCEVEQAILSKGLCNYHRFQQRKDRGELPVYTSKIKSIRENTLKVRKESRECLQEFFQKNIEILAKRNWSDEGGIMIRKPSIFNVCHIFPKSRYKSVQCHPLNVVYLTIDQHTKFDKLLGELDFSALEDGFPDCWEAVCERVRSLLPILEEKGKLKFKFEEYLQ